MLARGSLFWPISHTQIYPALRELEEQGLSRYHLVEQHAMRPDKKVYEITEEGGPYFGSGWSLLHPSS
jgi:DNA-binding PadR family transcriptional regulator